MPASAAVGINQLSNRTKSSVLAQLWAKVDECLEAASCQNMAFLLILMPVRKCQIMLKYVGAKQITN
jgi:hypothetical protein